MKVSVRYKFWIQGACQMGDNTWYSEKVAVLRFRSKDLDEI